MASTIKVDQIQLSDGSTPTAADLGLDIAGSVVGVTQVHFTTEIATTTTGTWISAHSTSFTPSSSTNKVMVMYNASAIVKTTGSFGVRLTRNGTEVVKRGRQSYTDGTNWSGIDVAFAYLDAPSTTSPITYAIDFRLSGGNTQFNSLDGNVGQTNPVTFTFIEIAQ